MLQIGRLIGGFVHQNNRREHHLHSFKNVDIRQRLLETIAAILQKQKYIMPLLHTVSITVKDLVKSISFYRTLGLAIPEAKGNEHHVEFTSEKGYSIGFIPETTMLHTNPHWQAPTGDNRIGLQFACGSPAEVDETYHRLIAAGHQSFKQPWDAFWGQRFAQVTDPDGNNVGLFAPLN